MRNKKTNDRKSNFREEFSFETGDFNAHQLLSLAEETKKKNKKKK
ncbi:hypothetical protein [Anoxybacteroides tepidamans]|nr:hypothetical protein [Anoxybacillus tepidamans]